MQTTDLTIPVFDRVPSEIWAVIFTDCLPDEDFIWPDPAAAPLVLCTVCKKWRSVVRLTSELWSSIHVEVSLGKDVREVMKGVARWLSWSGTRPLAISCTWNGNHDRLSYMALEQVPEWMSLTPLLELFSLAAERWEYLRLSFVGNFEGSILPNIEGKHTPALKSFELRLSPAYAPSFSVWPYPNLSHIISEFF
jgi:hypothetical protein